MENVHRIEVLSRDDCLELLGSVEVGRVVFTDRALPAILPVAFVVRDGDVVLRTAEGSRLARAARDAVLAFEADQVAAGGRGGWSVVVTGEARLESDDLERARLDALLTPWVPGIKDVFIRIPLTVVTGRRVVGRPVASAV
ncbi:pyridoxamine 5'-phosphate oxidase family protein [Thalassiella azotivora]